MVICGVQLYDKKRVTDLMLLLGLKKTMEQSAMANRVCLFWDVLNDYDTCNHWERALHFGVHG